MCVQHCVAVAVHSPSESNSDGGGETVPAFSPVSVPWLLSQLTPLNHDRIQLKAEMEWEHFKQKKLKPNC